MNKLILLVSIFILLDTNFLEAKIKIKGSNNTSKNLDNYGGIHFEEKLNSFNKNLSNGLSPNQSSWDEISDLAFRTYVPESEVSREKGAGGGDAND